jgi:hypothetical protein
LPTPSQHGQVLTGPGTKGSYSSAGFMAENLPHSSNRVGSLHLDQRKKLEISIWVHRYINTVAWNYDHLSGGFEAPPIQHLFQMILESALAVGYKSATCAFDRLPR